MSQPTQDPPATQAAISSVPVVHADNMEVEGRIKKIELYRAPVWKSIMKWTFYICTVGIGYLFCRWFPKFFFSLNFVLCGIYEAEWTAVYGTESNIELTPVKSEQFGTVELRVFSYRLFKYFYDAAKLCFMPVVFELNKKKCTQIYQEYEPGLDEETVKKFHNFYGKNLTEIPRRTVMQLLMEEVLSPFYIFQVFSFVVWWLDDYALYSCIIFFLSAISICITLYQTLETTEKLHKMSYYKVDVKAQRRINGELKTITLSSEELVPGDIIEIEQITMPCDAILLSGQTIMNESMLTGESIPIVKSPIPKVERAFNPKEDRQHILYAGTHTIQARPSQDKPVTALVINTGFCTVKGDLIRTMLFPKASDFEFYIDSFKFLGILAFLAVIGTSIDLYSWLSSGQHGMGWTYFIKGAQVITVTVPPALPTCMQIGVSVALSRLQEKKTFCISPGKINEAGRVNIMCFDKTGTLTEDGLDILGVKHVNLTADNKLGFSKLVRSFPKLSPAVDEERRRTTLQRYARNHRDGTSIYTSNTDLPNEQVLEALATCHSLTQVEGKTIGDPLDVKMWEATEWGLEENEVNDNGVVIGSVLKSAKIPEIKTVGIVRRFEFLSRLMRMSVIVKTIGKPGFRMHIKGSPEKIRELCRNSSIPVDFHETLMKYTENGYRVIALGTRTLDISYEVAMTAEREALENDFTFIGFLIVENRLKEQTTPVIDVLHNAEIRTIMVTGDNILTAISVARQCHIVGNNQKVFLGEMKEGRSGRQYIEWRNFEFSAESLNDDMEPEADARASVGPAEHEDETEVLVDRGTVGRGTRGTARTTINEEDLLPRGSMHMVDTEPPFFTVSSDYCIAVTGKTFSYILHQVEVKRDPQYKKILAKVLEKGLVYARMQPDEKALMIKHMKMLNKRNLVGMCGDGANDCVALKMAHVGVSLSQAEASIAAPFTSQNPNIECIPELLKEGRAALATSYQCFKYMALYSMIQFVAVTILYYSFYDFSNWSYYHQDILAILPFSSFMALSETSDTLGKYRPTGRLMSFGILLSVLGQFFLVLIFQLGSYIILVHEAWYVKSPSNWETKEPTYETSTLYLDCVYQNAFVALAFMVGPPFRKDFYTNYWFTGYFILFMAFNIIMTYNPFDWAWVYSDTLQAVNPMRESWKNFIFISQMINGACILIWERVVVDYAAKKRRETWEQKSRLEAEDDIYLKKRRLSEFMYDAGFKKKLNKDDISDTEDDKARKSA